MMRLVLAVLLSGARLATAQPQPDSQAGEFRFKMPEGWKRVEDAGLTILIPPDLPRGRVTYIAITPGQDLTTGLRAWFDKEWAQWQREYRLLDGGEIRAEHSPAGHDSIWTTGHVADKKGKHYLLFMLTAANGRRVGELAMLSDGQELLPAHKAALLAIIATLQVGGTASASAIRAATQTWPPPASGSGGLDGLYRTAKLTLTADYDPVLDRMSKKPGQEYYLFFPDGRFYFAYPDMGAQDFDYAAFCRRSGQFCGPYTMAGGRGSLTYKGGSTVAIERIDESTLRIGSKQFVRLDPCDGLTLEGTFRREDFREQYSPKEGITFTRDGRFADEGVAKAATVLWWTERSGYFDDDGKPGQGTYRIIRYSLELKYSDGRFKRITFNLEPGTPKVNVQKLILNTRTFVRVQ